jgi:hypothetical protein
MILESMELWIRKVVPFLFIYHSMTKKKQRTKKNKDCPTTHYCFFRVFYMALKVILYFHQKEPAHLLPPVVITQGTFDRSIDGKSGPVKKYTMTEMTFTYDFNGAIGLGYQIFPTSTTLDYHVGDIEGLYVLTDPVTNVPEHVYFKAHGYEQGQWRTWNQCEKTSDGTGLVAYIARGSHALYPSAGIWPRIFGFACDLCSNKGKQLILNVDIQQTVPPRGGITQTIPQTSSTWERRMFYPTANSFSEFVSAGL